MEMDDHMSRIMKMMGMDQDVSSWTQVGKLTPQELLRRRAMHKDAAIYAGQMAAAKARFDAVKAEVDAQSTQWWADLYKGHSLSHANYHLTEDGRILMEPKSNEKSK